MLNIAQLVVALAWVVWRQSMYGMYVVMPEQAIMGMLRYMYKLGQST